MRRSPLLLAVLLCAAAPVAAQPAAQDQPDPARYLPPPPAAGSARAAAELDELRHLQATSTPEELAAARSDDANENGTIFAVVLGPAWDMAKLPATAKMIGRLAEAEEAASSVAKKEFHRPRPWIVEPAIKTCTPHKPGPALNSYPSGHATIGYAMGVVLASEIPDKAQAILARSAMFAENRLVCGYHFRSDIVAGESFGTVLALRLMQAPAFQADMAASRAELESAHLIP
jgi:acid phosphatase (class A)